MFLAGVVMVLAQYAPEVVDRVVHPVFGLPGRTKFLPAISEIREACETEAAEQHRHRELLERWARPKLAGPDTVRRPLAVNATASALCERFGLRSIPAGWDAVDITRAAAKHGADLQDAVDRGLARPGPAGPGKGTFTQVVKKARAAMEEYGAGALAASPVLAARISEQNALRDAIPTERSAIAAELDDEIPF